jgi:hypothetical protein
MPRCLSVFDLAERLCSSGRDDGARGRPHWHQRGVAAPADVEAWPRTTRAVSKRRCVLHIRTDRPCSLALAALWPLPYILSCPIYLYPLSACLRARLGPRSICSCGSRRQECRNVEERQWRPGPPPRVLHRPSARGQPSFRSAARKLGAGGAGGGRQRPAKRGVSRGGGT